MMPKTRSDHPTSRKIEESFAYRDRDVIGCNDVTAIVTSVKDFLVFGEIVQERMDQKWVLRTVGFEHFGVEILHPVIVEGRGYIAVHGGVINDRSVGVTPDGGGAGVTVFSLKSCRLRVLPLRRAAFTGVDGDKSKGRFMMMI